MKHEKRTAGFTLVELIVVIAVMGILAGVGTVGYGGYVKSAAKKADLVTVGNVIRAIEVAGKSGAYTLDESLQPMASGGAQLPVGFVVLSQEGTETMESATGTTHVEGCSYGSGTGYIDVMVPHTFTWTTSSFFGNTPHNEQGYMIYRISVDLSNVCFTHSHISTKNLGSGTYYAYDGSYTAGTAPQQVGWRGQDFPNAIISDRVLTVNDFCQKGDGHIGDGGKDIYDSVDGEGNSKAETAASAKLEEILSAAYGSELSNISLQSGDWTSGTLPSFYSNVTELWDNIETLSGTLYDFVTTEHTLAGQGIKGNGTGVEIKVLGKSATVDLIGDEHDSSADLVYDVATAVVGLGSEDDFIENYWNKVATNGTAYDSQAFGLAGDDPGRGREYYSSVRYAYNSGVSSYVQQYYGTVEHSGGATDHADQILNFGDQAAALVLDKAGIDSDTIRNAINNAANGAVLPDCVCPSVFEESSKAAISGTATAHSGTGYFTFHQCDGCKQLYEQYVNSKACEESGRAFYQTMTVAANTPADILDGSTMEFFDYYNTYLTEFENLYRTAQNTTNGKSAIIIAVYYKNGELDYAVSPADANPRK